MKRLLEYRQNFRSLRTAKATVDGIETIRIKAPTFKINNKVSTASSYAMRDYLHPYDPYTFAKPQSVQRHQ